MHTTKTAAALPADLDTARDYTISINGRLVGWMRGNFAQASDPIRIAGVDGDGEWTSTGRQVADYRHNATDAALDLWDDEMESGDEIEAV